MTQSTRWFALVGTAALALGACSAEPEPVVTPSPSITPAITAPEVTEAPFEGPEVRGVSSIATALGSSIDVYDAPDGQVQQTVAAEDVLTAPEATPLVFLVKDDADGWLEVYLPVRPNGSTGWVRTGDVTLATTDFSVEVSLVDFELTVFDGQDAVLTTPISVGREDRPTPGGVYYIRELLQPPDPSGVYGPYAYGLSGYSPVLDEFNGGQAVIGLHGTDEPESIGQYVSSGCIRLPNDTITQIVNEVGLPLGTPVLISADAEPLASENA
ncbi:L,D-transpeptidase [Demequina muriae]|uniref:L,D-transpeptidase n=1 Tax=Demequina muriae TaxID=3051664 RepID=A0ABT8GFH0_9MICO|nr:L,D-transpeptidase [Demequina sp. EGI L300058]MDN4480182.1 L,D-transpeptidase [Demequina sp. EGI L300058]